MPSAVLLAAVHIYPFPPLVDGATLGVLIMPKEPSEKTIKRLFATYGNQCAFPKCSTPLVDTRSGTVLGEICHIKGRKPGAARYDSTQTDEERHDFENLIMLCGTHHKFIDDDEVAYTVERLQELKRAHEAMHAGGAEPNDDVVSALLMNMVRDIHHAMINAPTPLTEIEKAARYIELRAAIKESQWYKARDLLIGLENYKNVAEFTNLVQTECERIDLLAHEATDADVDGDLVRFIRIIREIGDNAPAYLAKRNQQAWSELVIPDAQILNQASSTVVSIKITPDGHSAVVGYKDSIVGVFDLVLGCERWAHRRQINNTVRPLAATSEDDSILVFSPYDRYNVDKWDYKTGKTLAWFRLSNSYEDGMPSVSSIVLTPEGEQIIIGFSDGRIWVWDVVKQEPLCKFMGHSGAINDLFVLSASRTIVSISSDGTANIWSLTQCQRVPDN
jgi:hypothetical protein